MDFSKRQPLSALAAPLIALALALVLPSGAAHARHLECGDRVTQDLKLDSDLRNCAGVGLVIAGDGVTLDLGGHTIDGTGRGTGIVNGYGGDGRRGFHVRNGTVRGFKVGLRSGGRGTTLRRLTVTRNATGGVVLRGSQCVVERSTISDNGYGHGISITGLTAAASTRTGSRVTSAPGSRPPARRAS